MRRVWKIAQGIYSHTHIVVEEEGKKGENKLWGLFAWSIIYTHTHNPHHPVILIAMATPPPISDHPRARDTRAALLSIRGATGALYPILPPLYTLPLADACATDETKSFSLSLFFSCKIPKLNFVKEN